MFRLLLFVLVGNLTLVSAEEPVRFATYNIQHLDSASTSSGRLEQIRLVIAGMEADVIGLQEIKDRKSLELVFNPADWQLIIDDDSGDAQDLALAVRKSIKVNMNGLNAGDGDFLFPGTDGATQSLFPRRRDVLAVKLTLPQTQQDVLVLVHHAKARVGGRATTAPRRNGAAQAIVQALDTRMDDTPVILMGDFNDSPDDASLNILEQGNPAATAEMEENEGSFFVNLTEPLWAQDHVSQGWKNGSQELQIVLPGIRSRQFEDRNGNTTPNRDRIPALLDNILINQLMKARYTQGSTRIYHRPEAHIASDHLPVYADFLFEADAPPPPPPPITHVSIAELLPNPDGSDAGREEIVLVNLGSGEADLEGWFARDRSGSTLNFSGTLGRGMRKTYLLPANSLALTNSGDELSLIDDGQNQVDHVSYTKDQAKSGARIVYIPADQIPPGNDGGSGNSNGNSSTEPPPNDDNDTGSGNPPPDDGGTGTNQPVSLVRYYAAAAGKTGAELKKALNTIIGHHRQFTYSQVWDILQIADEDPNDPESVLAFYKRVPIKKAKRVSGSCTDCWNREHIWAKSHGFPNSGQLGYTDTHHLRASDVTVNSSRGSLDFDDGGQPEGECSGCRKDGDSWEPPTEVRGDVARMMFYMDTRYDGSDANMPDLILIKGDSANNSNTFGDLCALLKWHLQDPPDAAERKRNDIIFGFQGNRNPFIDHPEFVQAVWGNGACE